MSITEAFLAAQKQFPQIPKTKTATIKTATGTYSYRYADFADIMAAVLPILHKHGLALSQATVSEPGLVGVHTTLHNESGDALDLGTLLLPSGGTPQNAGSAITYARRYALTAGLGLVTDEDIDGQIDDSETWRRRVNQIKADILEHLGDKTKAAALFDEASDESGFGEHPMSEATIDRLEAVVLSLMKGEK